MIAPIDSSATPNYTHAYPPLRDVYIEAYYGNSGDPIGSTYIGERAVPVERLYANSFGAVPATSAIDPSESIEIRIRPGTAYAPVMLGWIETSDDGINPPTDTEMEQDLSSAASFSYDDTTGSSWTYRWDFCIWRKPFV